MTSPATDLAESAMSTDSSTTLPSMRFGSPPAVPLRALTHTSTQRHVRAVKSLDVV